MCFNKSFATSDKAQYWSDKNELKPRNIFKSSDSKYKFNCDECNNEFDASLNNITAGMWCSMCKNKTEKKLQIHLKDIHPTVQHQFRIDWCKNTETNRYLPFDFVIESLKIIIELDGAQHFQQVSNWKCPEETCERDKYKIKCANDNGYTIIRILQEDVFYNRTAWKDDLDESIKLYDEPTRIFISDSDKYDNHKED